MGLTAFALAVAALAPKPFATKNVFFVMADGLRWQEVFRGADSALLEGAKRAETAKGFVGETPAIRRERLMPFVTGEIAKSGLLIGDHDAREDVGLANPLRFSYPGYSESLVGYVDPWVDSNDPRPNRNVTVYEWLARRPDWRGAVGAFGAWNVIGDVFNRGRAPFTVNAGYDPLTSGKITDGIRALNRIKAEQPRDWEGEPYDAVTFRTAMEWVGANKPRLAYISLGEPDEWAHAGDYPRYLTSIRLFDDYVRELWAYLQSQPQYRGKTTLILASDHGRGEGKGYTSHGEKVPEAANVWMAFLGPDTPARGSGPIGSVRNAQIPATIAALLGYDYPAAQPKAFAPVAAALPR